MPEAAPDTQKNQADRPYPLETGTGNATAAASGGEVYFLSYKKNETSIIAKHASLRYNKV